MLQYCFYPFPQFALEVVEDEVRVHLGHCLQFFLHVVSEDHILKSKVEGGTHREMADD